MVLIRIKPRREIIKQLRAENAELRRIIKQIRNSTRCPYCAATISIKNGTRNTEKGFIQRYKCLSCNKKFSLRQESFRMRHDSDLINKARRLHKKGLTTREIQKEIGSVSHVAIHRWIKNFGDI